MIGAITGNFIGTEFTNTLQKAHNLLELTSAKSAISCHSFMIAATADALINDLDFDECYMRWGQLNTLIDFDDATEFWLLQSDINYLQVGTDSAAAVRCGIIGMLDIPLHQILDLAAESARCTHNTTEGIASAQAVCYVVHAVRNNKSTNEIYEYLQSCFNYERHKDHIEVARSLTLTPDAKHIVLAAVHVALESKSWEDCIRSCVNYFDGNDTNSIMCIASLIKSQYCPVSEKYSIETKRWLFQNYQQILQMLEEFEHKKWMCKLPF